MQYVGVEIQRDLIHRAGFAEKGWTSWCGGHSELTKRNPKPNEARKV